LWPRDQTPSRIPRSSGGMLVGGKECPGFRNFHDLSAIKISPKDEGSGTTSSTKRQGYLLYTSVGAFSQIQRDQSRNPISTSEKRKQMYDKPVAMGEGGGSGPSLIQAQWEETKRSAEAAESSTVKRSKKDEHGKKGGYRLRGIPTLN